MLRVGLAQYKTSTTVEPYLTATCHWRPNCLKRPLGLVQTARLLLLVL